MKINFEEVKSKVKVWGEKDWNNGVEVGEGKFEVLNRCGGVEYELSKEEYFGDLEKVSNFGELESWFWSIMGENSDGGFGMWLDEVMKK